jgi:phenylpropionate dioxygenase-like ring-hydroxylating dioxygenase large terminal subunit
MQVPENLWYPVLESRELKRRPLAAERFGQNLVFWRTNDGQPHAHTDRCPHLGAALSGGTVAQDRLTCPFHGFAFGADGQCRHIPANGKSGRIPKGMELKTFTLREAHGFIWLWHGAPTEALPEPPFFPQLADGWRFGSVSVEWPVHLTRAIENQLDVAHLPFVHRTTIGAGGRSLVEGPYVEADEHAIRVWVTNRRDDGQPAREMAELATAAGTSDPALTYIFPGQWLLDLGPRLKNVVAFVPVNATRTRYYLRVYHRRNPLLARPYEAMMGIANRFILNQDRRVVITQTPPDSLAANDDRLIGADRAIIQFRRIYARLLNQAAPVAGEPPSP